ncbi:hypothetical protein D3C71_1809420 [compost metagenome]
MVVTTGDITQFQEDLSRWIGQVGSVFGFQAHSFDLIATQMDKIRSHDQLTVRDIRKETQMQVIGKIHKYAEIVPLLNRGKLIELLQTEHPLRTDISSVTQKFIDIYGLTRTMKNSRLPWFKRILNSPAVT